MIGHGRYRFPKTCFGSGQNAPAPKNFGRLCNMLFQGQALQILQSGELLSESCRQETVNRQD